jgi:hypothetical protein
MSNQPMPNTSLLPVSVVTFGPRRTTENRSQTAPRAAYKLIVAIAAAPAFTLRLARKGTTAFANLARPGSASRTRASKT